MHRLLVLQTLGRVGVELGVGRAGVEAGDGESRGWNYGWESWG